MIHLQLQPEVEAQLAAEAQAHGLELDRYVESIVASYVLDPIYIEAEALDEHKLDQDLQQGLRDIAAGNTRPAREVFAELGKEFGIYG
jgi:hypothetical protein